jgi:hypothetical protein
MPHRKDFDLQTSTFELLQLTLAFLTVTKSINWPSEDTDLTSGNLLVPSPPSLTHQIESRLAASPVQTVLEPGTHVGHLESF